MAAADEIAGREVQAPAAAPPPPSQPLPSATPPLARRAGVYRLQLTEEQVRHLVEGVQRMKYPHQVKPDQKPSMEEFEELEALRNALLDAIQ
ncbi:MAG: hypothetical protein ACYDGR_00510 [Candidatus Dormibacteria bacterium]